MFAQRILSVLICAGLAGSNAVAQELTLDQILAKNEDALGGAAAISKVQTLKMTASMIEPNGQGQARLTSWNKRPHFVRSESELNGKRTIAGYDGATAWIVDPSRGSPAPRKLDVMAASDLADSSIDTAIGSLASFKAAGYAVELLGKDDFAGTAVYRIQVTRKNGMEAVYLIDAASYLPVKTITIGFRQGLETEIEGFPGDYKKVGDILFAHSIQQRIGGRPIGKLIYEKIEINTSMDDSMFKMPGPEPPAVKK
jgi:outer membrane lipoprotein-sorting protein